MIYRKNLIYLLLVIAGASISIRLLMFSEFGHSALLYVGIPFLIALTLIALIEPVGESKLSLGRYYGQFALWSLVVMLCTSIVLYEGFVCVLMFMPIYFGILFLIAMIHMLGEFISKRGKNKHYVQIIPALIVLSAFEGVIPEFEFNRDYSVTREIIVSASQESILAELTKPMELDVDRHWLLEIFPMPANIDAGTLSAGGIHKIDYVYHRWFVTNTHAGSMHLEISELNENFIRTTFIEDSSYIKNYLKLEGTEIHFEQLDDYKTKVSLTIHYQRFLDPAWYFGPLQSYAIGEVAELLLAELFVPD